MSRIKIFQTLENRDNPEQIERDGPFICRWNNSWLGTGYYYWDTFLFVAHWWGKMRYNENHIICEAVCEFNDKNCLDLVGNTNHMNKFFSCVDIMKTKKLVNEKTTVSRVINYMKETLKAFDYEAIRVYGINSISPDNYPEYTNRLYFEAGKMQYLDVTPAIQICIYNKTGLGMSNYRIIFPAEYDNNYMV